MTSHRYDRAGRVLYLIFPDVILSTNHDLILQSVQEILSTKTVWNREWDRVVLDLADTRMIDSLGLNVLIKLIRRVSDRPAKVAIAASNTTVYQTLLTTRMDRMADLKRVDEKYAFREAYGRTSEVLPLIDFVNN